MLDFGFVELLLILIVSVFVIGPKELPTVMAFVGRIFRRFQYLRFAMSKQMDDMMRDAGLDDVRNQVNFEAQNFDEAAADEDIAAIDPADAHAKALKERAEHE